MIGDNHPKYRWSELERLAGDLRSLPGVSVRGKVRVEFAAQRYGDATIRPMYGLVGCSVEGMVCRSDNGGRKYRILVDQFIADGASESHYNAVIAEELGHIRCHENMIASINTETEFRELHLRPDWRQLEREAKYFGRALFMPKDLINTLVRQCYSESIDAIGFASPTAVFTYIIGKIANHVVMPPKEVEDRFRDLGLDHETRILASVSVRSSTLLTMDDVFRPATVRPKPRADAEYPLFPEEV